MTIETTDQLLSEASDHWDKNPGSNLYKLVDSLNAPLELISDDSIKVEQWREINQAEGTTLDLLGKDRQAPRTANDDALYRFLIYIRALLSRAQGTLPSIVNISATAFQTNARFIKIWQTGVRHIDITVPLAYQDSDLKKEKIITANLQQLVALGIWLNRIRWQSQSKSQDYQAATIMASEHYELSAI